VQQSADLLRAGPHHEVRAARLPGGLAERRAQQQQAVGVVGVVLDVGVQHRQRVPARVGAAGQLAEVVRPQLRVAAGAGQQVEGGPGVVGVQGAAGRPQVRLEPRDTGRPDHTAPTIP